MSVDLDTLAKAVGATHRGDGWIARCLFAERHNNGDANPSMAVFESRDGGALLTCKVKCATTAALMAEARRRDLIVGNGNAPKQRKSATKGTPPWKRAIRTEYPYRDAAGKVISHKVRFENDGLGEKCTFAYPPDHPSRWKAGAYKSILYNLPDVIAAKDRNDLILVCEGEGDVEILRAQGFTATTNPEGASQGEKPKWKPKYTTTLDGARVAILRDYDKPGENHAKQIANALSGNAAQVLWVDLPGLTGESGSNDVTDWFANGGTADQLDRILADAPDWTAEQETAEGRPLEFSDDALATAFTAFHGDEFRYVHEWRQWLRWADTVWERDRKLRMFSAIRGICRSAAGHVETAAAQRQIASAKTVASVATLARADPKHAMVPEEFDADIWMLNTPGGVVDLRTGTLSPPNPKAYWTKQTLAAPEGECPLFLQTLEHATGGDQELIGFLQRWFGYNLCGSVQEQALVFCHGPGQTGKSTIIGAVQQALGDYSETVPMEMLTTSRQDRHPTEIAKLAGARMAVAVETEEGKQWAEARVKWLTGGDTLTGRKMRADFFDFKPQFKLTIHGNYKPHLRNPDEAMRRRFKVVRFDNTVPEGVRDRDLLEKLRAEAGGILRWAIAGGLEWQRDGLNPPESVEAETRLYFDSEDVVARWIADCCKHIQGTQVSTAILYASYQRWCEASGEHATNQQGLTQTMTGKGYKYARKENWRGFYDLTVSPQDGHS